MNGYETAKITLILLEYIEKLTFLEASF